MPSAKSSQKKDPATISSTSTSVVETDDKKAKTKGTKAALPEPVIDVAQVEVKKVAKPRAKKETMSVVNVVPVNAPMTGDTVLENTVVATDSVEISITENFTEFITRFQGLIGQFQSLKTELKNLEKKTVKQLKIVEKIQNKKRKKATRAPSGFVKPAPISNELAHFLGKPEGSEMARTDVTREINKYIRANNLQDKENGRKINPDKLLSDLLKIDNEVCLTYFNLQRYMGPHFPKQIKPETMLSAVTAAVTA